MDIDRARAVASVSVAYPTEAATATLVVLLAILDELIAARVAAQPPDEKPAKGAKVKS